MSKGILISYPGYPYTPSSLLPDNGLANLAGALIARGHSALILDYGTKGLISRLVPESNHLKLKAIYSELLKLKSSKEKALLKKLALIYRLKAQDRALARHQANEVARISDEIVDVVKSGGFNFVGFKLWLGDGYEGSVKIARKIKTACPGVKIFGGGPLVDEAEGVILEDSRGVFDALVYGDGEEAVVGLAEFSEGKKNPGEIPNVIFISEGRIVKTAQKLIDNLDDLPLPIYDEDVYPAMKGDEKIKIIVLDESRGCPNRCYFCPHVYKSGGRWRVKTSGRIFDEMKRVIEKYGIHAFRYAGSCTPAKIMIGAAQSVLESGLDVVYTSFANAAFYDSESFSLLKKSGLCALFFGVESGDERILNEMMNKKMLNPDLIRQRISAAMEAGLYCVSSVIFPAPGETSESREKTITLLKSVYRDIDWGSVETQFPGLFPGTEWYKNASKFGFKVHDPKNYVKQILNYKIKLLFPPSFWKPVPYSLDGMSFREFTRKTEDFVKELEENNICTMVTDEMALMAGLLGVKPLEYRNRTRLQLLTGDWRGLEADIKAINLGLTSNAAVRERMRNSSFSVKPV